MKVIHKKLRGSANYGPPCSLKVFRKPRNTGKDSRNGSSHANLMICQNRLEVLWETLKSVCWALSFVSKIWQQTGRCLGFFQHTAVFLFTFRPWYSTSFYCNPLLNGNYPFLHCALASGTVYCNRCCLCVCLWRAGGRCLQRADGVCGGRAVSITHDNSKLCASIFTKLGL